MSESEWAKKAEAKMQKNIEALKTRLRPLRTGRANPSLLDSVNVVYYGALTPLSQIAHISSPDPRSLLIKPFDSKALKDIEHAIVKANIGLAPQSDSKAIRLIFPELTEERRKALAKTVRKEAEKCRVDLRMSRRAVNEEIKALTKDKQISEDDQKRFNEEIQKITDSFMEQAETVSQTKEKEILKI